MLYFSFGNIIIAWFHVDNYEGHEIIWCGVIIGQDLVVKIGLVDYFNHSIMEFGCDSTHTKQSVCQSMDTFEPNITKIIIQNVIMHTAELYYNK